MSDAVIDRVLDWARGTADVRAVILTSSRARPDASADEFSDWDVVLAVPDPAALAEGDLAWQAAVGTRLVGWGDEGELLGHRTFSRGVIYADDLRVDYSFWPIELLDAVADADALPPELDGGYTVLLDKDGRTATWPAPSFGAYVLRPPTPGEYRDLVEEFWWNMSYLPKSIRRGDLFFLSSWMLEHDMKMVCLRRMLEWRIGAQRGWTWAPGPYGRGLERFLDAETRRRLAATYARLDADALWAAAFELAGLFRDTAIEVGAALGYRYPLEIDSAMRDRLGRARERM